jgi:hypothetical protein
MSLYTAFHEEDSEEKRMDVDDKGNPQASPALSDAHTPVELPVSFKLAMELAFRCCHLFSTIQRRRCRLLHVRL